MQRTHCVQLVLNSTHMDARASLPRHVHCGNIFLSDTDHMPLLAEWEQGLLGLPSHTADLVAELRRALEPAAASLALCLYEMACGFELDNLPPVFPPGCPTAVRETLDVMLRAPASGKGKRPPRTLEDTLELPLFARAPVRSLPAPVGRAGSSRDEPAAPPPLSADVLQHAAQVLSGRGDPTMDRSSCTTGRRPAGHVGAEMDAPLL